MFRVAFEGSDGSGKSVVCKLVCEKLRQAGVDVVLPTSDPQRPIRSLYKHLIAQQTTFPDTNTSLFLGLADFAYSEQLANEAEASIALFERCVYSPIADAIALGADPEMILPILDFFTQPDLIAYCDLSPELSLERRRSICTEAEAGGPFFLRPGEELQHGFLRFQSGVQMAYEMILPKSSLLVLDSRLDPDFNAQTVVDSVIGHLRGELRGSGNQGSDSW